MRNLRLGLKAALNILPGRQKKNRARGLFSRRRGATAGQSLLELAVFFPIMLMLIAGVVEFGFLLNQYLNLIDGPREAARFAVTQNPFIGIVGSADNPCFYSSVAAETVRALNPVPTNTVVELNPAQDDVVISVFTINADAVIRYPLLGHLDASSCPAGSASESADSTSGEWHLYGLGSGCNVDTDLNCHPSRFTSAEIVARVTATSGGEIPPSMGVVLVEVYYGYHQVLKLPWLAFVGDPVRVYTFTMMPLPAAAP